MPTSGFPAAPIRPIRWIRLSVSPQALPACASPPRRWGRDAAAIGLAFLANWYREDLSRRNDEGKRFILTGSDRQVAEDAAALRDIGVTRLMFNLLRPSLEQTFAAIDRFRDNVMARLAS